MDHEEGMAWTEKWGNIPEEAQLVLLNVVKESESCSVESDSL